MSDMNNDVLPPWSPIESHCSGELVLISLWGRQYAFRQSPFPSRIESAGGSILAGPVRVSVRVDGELEKWEYDSIQTGDQTPASVTFLQRAESRSVVLRASTAVEYDGMIRIDWKLEPRHAIQLESLTVDIPLRKEHATLYYYCPRRDREGPGTGGGTGGLVPANDFAIGFSPYVWLGDEQRGLAWFGESAQNWSHDGVEHAIEIIPSRNEIILRLKLVTDPVALAPKGDALADLSYTFGLQATPVRPIERDAWDTRIYHVNQELPEFREVRLKISGDVLDDMARSGVRTVCIHEHWTDIEGYFTTDHGKDLKQLVANCHERGMQILLYFGFLISDLAPEWPTMGEVCVIHPQVGYMPFDYPPQPLQNAYSVCYNSRWKDVTVEGIGNVIAQYGIDGIYLDGTTTPSGCRNPAHGCGYRRSDGTLGFTYPIFAVRELMKKLYTLVVRNNPDGQVNVHSSHYLTVPTIAWTTGYTDGEQFAWNEVEQKIVADDARDGGTSAQKVGLPLDRFRCEFMGHNLGVPADFLADIRGPFSSLSRACSFALLHDVPVRIWMRFKFELQQQLWKVRDDFGCKEAEWLPYWRNSAYVKVQPRNVYCSLHRHPGNGVLAIISNLGSEEQIVTADFSLGALGVGMDVIASDALNSEILDMTKGSVTLTLSSLGWKLIKIKKR